ncbi:PEP-CTERM sorting domain-containing protein [Aeoliella mucimassa]|uniref:PEP-CTERM protein-sorting domain-containing protein n=1 Tax=Aeoliella mucimassa TaxID=2527972 RepID=A0A518APN6_9BACT|nr:PEP-CTERM sorting domain-containing protein [Aeoliella mucimassa]QDU56671.1 hypothetical protein Pan181_28810 [Aeoliella mucimassa]
MEDVQATLMIDVNGESMPVSVSVEYTGDVKLGDLNDDGMINAADWTLFKSGQGVVNPGMSAVMAYQMGDLDGDGYNLLQDYSLFTSVYDAENGLGAFAALTSAVPEPTSLALLASVGVLLLVRKSRLWQATLCLSLIALLPASPACAVILNPGFESPGTTGFPQADDWAVKAQTALHASFSRLNNETLGASFAFTDASTYQTLSETYSLFTEYTFQGYGANDRGRDLNFALGYFDDSNGYHTLNAASYDLDVFAPSAWALLDGVSYSTDISGSEIGIAQYNTWKSNFGESTTSAWESIASQNLAGFPVGDGSGNGWEEGAVPGSIHVAEYYLEGESTIAVDASPISLGDLYGGGVAGPEDLLFEYVISDGSVVQGWVNYATEPNSLVGTNNAVPEPSTLLVASIMGIIVVGVRRTLV